MTMVYVVTTLESEFISVHSSKEKAQECIDFLGGNHLGKELTISHEGIDDPHMCNECNS